MKEILTEYELIVATYEQVRERPGDNDESEKYFSGKQSNHTFKSQIIIMPDGRDIVDVVAGKPGSKSDITMLFRRIKLGIYESAGECDRCLRRPQSRTEFCLDSSPSQSNHYSDKSGK